MTRPGSAGCVLRTHKPSRATSLLKIDACRSFFRSAYLRHLLLCGALLAGCAPSHVLHYREDVSRDYTTISFARNRAPYQHRAGVGGEHISAVMVSGFAGDFFLVELRSATAAVGCHISGEGLRIAPGPAGSGKHTVTIVEGETLIAVEVYAHPYGDYELIITKQQKAKVPGAAILYRHGVSFRKIE